MNMADTQTNLITEEDVQIMRNHQKYLKLKEKDPVWWIQEKIKHLEVVLVDLKKELEVLESVGVSRVKTLRDEGITMK